VRTSRDPRAGVGEEGKNVGIISTAISTNSTFHKNVERIQKKRKKC
jgi:hypothetical protein